MPAHRSALIHRCREYLFYGNSKSYTFYAKVSLVFVGMFAFVFIQFIDNHYIIPSIVAKRVKINALISVIVILIGGAVWGIPGIFLSIPLTAILKVIFDHVESLKPWGFLLGNIVPSATKYSLKRNIKIHP